MNTINKKITRMSLLLGAMLFLGTAIHADVEKKGEPTEKANFLGVYATRVSPALSHQLGFQKGFYLTVEQIEPESPADEAGLQTHDVLQKVDDQILINPEQLRELIRAKKAGDTIKLTFFRGGNERTVETKLVSREVPISDASGLQDPWQGKLPILPNGWTPRGPRQGQLQLPKGLFNNRSPLGKSDFELPEEARKQLENLGIDLDKLQEGGAGVKSFSFTLPFGDVAGSGIIPGTPDANVSVHSSKNMHFAINNDHGSLSLTMNDGKGDLIIRDNKGDTLYAGPYEKGKEIKKLPGHWQERLHELDTQIEKGTSNIIKPNELPEEARKQLENLGIDLDKLQEGGAGVKSFSFTLPFGDVAGSGIIPGTPDANVSVHSSKNMHFAINNDHGSLSLTMNDGKGDLIIRDNKGDTLYKGPYEKGKEIKKLPDHWQECLHDLDTQIEKGASNIIKPNKKAQGNKHKKRSTQKDNPA
ncbi:MAG: PDZ domain-containing protein [Opitutales bacterium]|nr:PDZ domain-containing protein [Opitutales bacterium]